MSDTKKLGKAREVGLDFVQTSREFAPRARDDAMGREMMARIGEVRGPGHREHLD